MMYWDLVMKKTCENSLIEKNHNQNTNNSIVGKLPKNLWESIFSYLKKRHVMSVALTCVRFSGIFKQKRLQNIISKNNALDYIDASTKVLKCMMLKNPDEAVFIAIQVRERFLNKKISIEELRSIISSSSLSTWVIAGRLFKFKDFSDINRQDFFITLLEKFGDSVEYYSGREVYKNPFFLSLVDSMRKMDINNLGKLPKVEEHIFSAFELSYLSLQKNVYQGKKICEVFDEYFSSHSK